MEKAVPRFVRRDGPGSKVVFITKDRDGREVELSLWDLVNLRGADEVLRMRERYPETKE